MMKRIFAVVLLVAVPARAQLMSNDNSIGVWPWLAGVNINNTIPSIVSNCQAMGLDTVYLSLYRATGAGTGILYMADETGTWNLANGSLSNLVTLSNFIAQCHAAKIQVVGVIGCFPDNGPNPGTDPAHEQMLLNAIDYLVHTYGVSGDPIYRLDGIALDRFRFHGGTGNPSAPVTTFTANVKALLGTIPLHGFLIGSPYYIDGNTYDAVFPGYAWSMGQLQSGYGQNWEALAPYLDVYMPMAYCADGGVYGTNYTRMQSYCSKVSQYVQQALTNSGYARRIVPAIMAWVDQPSPNGPGASTPASIDACMQGVLQGGGHGCMAYRYETALPYPSWFTTIGTHSTPTANRPLPYVGATVQGLTVSLNASAVSDNNEPATSLQVRFDRNGDGSFDTGLSTTKTWQYLASGLGTHRAGMEVRDSTGLTGAYKRRISVVGSPMTVFPGTMSTAAGGVCNFTINVGVAGGNLPYVIAGSATGTSPGTTVAPGVVVPLVVDAFTETLFLFYNTPLLPGFTGTLAAAGTGNAAVVVPAGVLPPSLNFFTLRFATVILDAAGTTPVSSTNATSILLLP